MYADHSAFEGLYRRIAAFFPRKGCNALTPARLQGYTVRRVLPVTPCVPRTLDHAWLTRPGGT